MLKRRSITAADKIKFYENKKEFGLTFERGINPKILIDAIHDLEEISASSKT